MKMSTEGLIALIGHEGIVLSRYKDSVGVWTIGVGHTAAAGGMNPATFTGTLTITQAIELLRTDIAKYEKAVDAAVKVPLKQYEFDALVSFHYNTGAIDRAELTKSLNGGMKAKAGQQFLNYMKPPEIGKRRRAESKLFLDGVYPEPVATIYPTLNNGAVQWGKGRAVNVRDLLSTSTTPPPVAPATPIAPVVTPKPVVTPAPKPAPVPTPAPVKRSLLADLGTFFTMIFRGSRP